MSKYTSIKEVNDGRYIVTTEAINEFVCMDFEEMLSFLRSKYEEEEDYDEEEDYEEEDYEDYSVYKEMRMRNLKIYKATKNLFDNKLGWSEGRNPYAPRELWVELGEALYGEDDERVKELRR